MGVPVTRFRELPNNTTIVGLNTAVKRLAAVVGEAVRGVGNPVDFGTVNISAGANRSVGKVVAWDVTADGNNSAVADFKLWLSSVGFVTTDAAAAALTTPFSTVGANPTFTLTGHGFTPGQTVTFPSGSITGLVPATALDGVHTIATTPDADTFTLQLNTAITTAPTAATVIRKGSWVYFAPLSGADNAAPALTQNYINDAIPGDAANAPTYDFQPLPNAEPTQNVWPTDEGTSMVLPNTGTGASDDVVMFALYTAIEDNETTGTYSGVVAGYELQLSFKYTYS